jgi:magnesium chelatase subunit D
MQPQMQATGELRSAQAKQPQASANSNKLDLIASQGKQAQGKSRATRNWSQSINWFSSLVAGAIANQDGKPELRFRRQRGGDPTMHLLLLDTSASTLQGHSQAQAKGLVAGLAQQAYIARQQMLLLGFGNDKVEELYALGRAPKAMAPLLDNIGAGGGTPLKQAVQQAQAFGQRLLRRNPATRIINYIITDGRVQEDIHGLHLPGTSLLVDTEQAQVKRGRGPHIAKLLGADYLTLAQTQLKPTS